MAKCPACGGEISDAFRYCPLCGCKIDPEDEKPVRDYWAEKLSPGEEDWTKEVPDDELEDLNAGEAPWMGPDVPAPDSGEDPSLDVRPKPRPRWSITFLVVVLAAAAIAAALLCGKLKAEPELAEGAGTYNGLTCAYEDEILSIKNDWVELREDHTFRLSVLQGIMTGDWTLEGQGLKLTTEFEELHGEIQDGCLILDYSGTECIFALPGFENQAPDLRKQISRSTVPSVLPDCGAWEGDYYGYMVMTRGEGRFAGIDGKALDVCGRIVTFEDGLGRIEFWSSENKKGESFCTADVLFKDGTGPMGQMIVEWGLFCGMEMQPGAWAVDPGKSRVCDVENLFYTQGKFLDTTDPESSYCYEIFFMPWGKLWEEADSRYPGLLPPGYEQWYLPLIGAGQPMPEHF